MISQRFLPAVGMATFIVLFGSAAIAADNKVDTLEPACTCDCGGVYHRVKLSGTISCSDVSDSKKECIKGGKKYTLKDCDFRMAPSSIAIRDGQITVRVDEPQVFSNGDGDVPRPGIMFSKTTINCKSGKNFVISTGNNSGSCTVNKSDGEVTGGTCTDGANEASADCKSNAGQGACGNTQGSAECTIAK